MGLHKQLDTALSDSVKTTYHRVVELSFNSLTGRVLVTVFSYITEADEEAGKAPYSQSSYELSTVNPLEAIAAGDVGKPVMFKVQQMLEAAIVAEVPEFAGATIA